MATVQPKPRVLPPILPNAGLEAKYRRRLQRLIADMHGSMVYWLRAAIRDNPPRLLTMAQLAQDAKIPRSGLKRIQWIMDDLADKWANRIYGAADDIARAHVSDSFAWTDGSMKRALKDAGWSVEFRMDAAMREAFDASLATNVELIQTIPTQYLSQVSGIVTRGYAAGRDLETMVKELQALYPGAAHRAVLIARDQSNKANAVVNRARQMELGIDEAEWHHSHAGKDPRQTHVAAHKRRYKIAQGCEIPLGSGKFILPGEEINCRCCSRIVLPG